MKARFTIRLALTVAAAMLAWPPTAVLALSTVCTGTSQVFNFTPPGAVESFTVPPGVTQVTIDAAGAAGGSPFVNGGGGGKGAELAASFAVTPGKTLNILVGSAGGNSGGLGGGGGGGSFVYTSATATGLLIAAAGGGGSTHGDPGDTGNAGNAANGGTDGGSGGSGGNGGGGGTLGGGGGGLLSNGGDSTSGGGGGGAALANGGGGGGGGSGFGGGGFGGGGGGSPFGGGGGGGGGYNGGGGGGAGAGGGGGSYSAATPSFAQSGAQSGNGQVSFCFTVAFAGTPGFSNCHGQSVAALAQQYGDLTAAAAALGFPRVPALQAAIKSFCGN